ncbi:quinone-dependent dihydroorotate dehydrogenase [Brachybacterium sp. JB7]|nr:quinone-dependent dihydroorotate dehydrogenase [Brachybacterium sp. JB7]RCS72094.1 quinone-dependent dihydroorotate dehydrogenase [Brachybacterium alimentarium]RCS74304.1 quinone-dependent dihydroorotate dehydrogenase [Brachybacterium alimentarium]RCS81857.1 quinone-dependent dihydroorotate dehydrogenase [Brachybacterium alimentarium]
MTMNDTSERGLYTAVFSHALSRLDAEQAHRMTMRSLHLAYSLPGGPWLLRALFGTPDPMRDPRPAKRVLGADHRSPLGLAAGFDKDGEVPLALLDLGFGHVEVGTVTAKAQPGNPAPRSFRLIPDRALINRMGFNNHGAHALAKSLAAARRTERGQRAVIGVNIGKSKVTALDDAAEDYRFSARILAPYASYLAINVSSPNTPGLRDLQTVEMLRPVLEAVVDEARRAERRLRRELPVLVKIAPDLHDDDVRAVAHLATEVGLAGVIAANTTISRPESLRTTRSRIDSIGSGGLSGPMLAERSLEMLTLLRRELPESSVIISCGGVTTAQDVRTRLEAGADLVQGYTAMIYEGPAWPGRLAREVGPFS